MVDEAPSSDIHQDCGGATKGELVPAHQVTRLRTQRDAKDDGIRIWQKHRKIGNRMNGFETLVVLPLARNCNAAHPECARPPRNFATDRTGANDQGRAAFKRGGARHEALVPPCTSHGIVCWQQLPVDCQCKTNSMLRNNWGDCSFRTAHYQILAKSTGGCEAIAARGEKVNCPQPCSGLIHDGEYLPGLLIRTIGENQDVGVLQVGQHFSEMLHAKYAHLCEVRERFKDSSSGKIGSSPEENLRALRRREFDVVDARRHVCGAQASSTRRRIWGDFGAQILHQALYPSPADRERSCGHPECPARS